MLPPQDLPLDAATSLASLLASDRDFITWVDSSSGKSSLALQLKTLRTRAAERTIQQVMSSVEGRQGLLTTISALAGQDPAFAASLRALLRH